VAVMVVCAGGGGVCRWLAVSRWMGEEGGCIPFNFMINDTGGFVVSDR
jgi:hypothetical protein